MTKLGLITGNDTFSAFQAAARPATSPSKHYSGPIPEPSDLQQYENIKIGFAERIITMAEHEAGHRQGIEHKIINSERVFNIFGQLIAACMGFSVMALMWYALSKGYAEQVKWIGVSIASVVGLFIYKRK